MLQGLFNYDNPVWRFIGKLGDLILLNILWIVFHSNCHCGSCYNGCVLCDFETGPR
jgi:hypothetical protein